MSSTIARNCKGTILVFDRKRGVERYRPFDEENKGEDSNETTYKLQCHRRGHVGARLSDGRVLIAGGTNTSGSLLAMFKGVLRGGVETLCSAEIFDAETMDSCSTTEMQTKRYCAAAASLNDEVYVSGGMDSSSMKIEAQIHSTVESFDPSLSTWCNGPSLHRGRHSHTMTTLQGALYVVGGKDKTQVLGSVEKWMPDEHTWSTSDKAGKSSLYDGKRAMELGVERYGHAACALDGGIYACGGSNGTTSVLKSCERFDSGIGEWMPVSSMARPRLYFALVPLNRCLYAIGGAVGSLKSVERYDPAEDKWSEVKSLRHEKLEHTAISVP